MGTIWTRWQLIDKSVRPRAWLTHNIWNKIAGLVHARARVFDRRNELKFLLHHVVCGRLLLLVTVTKTQKKLGDRR